MSLATRPPPPHTSSPHGFYDYTPHHFVQSELTRGRGREKTTLPGQFGGSPRPSARWLIAISPAARPPSPHPTLQSRLHDPIPRTFVEIALLTLNKYVIVASAGSAWRELDSRSGLAFGPSHSGLHRARSKRETQLPSKGGPPSARGTPRLAPHSRLADETTFPGQFGGSPRPSARWLIAISPAARPSSPHPSCHHVCMTPPLTLLSRSSSPEAPGTRGATFPGQFGGSPRPSARWLIATSPAGHPPSPHPSSHRVCMTPPLKLLSRPPS